MVSIACGYKFLIDNNTYELVNFNAKEYLKNTRRSTMTN
jgi:hypothetical protein